MLSGRAGPPTALPAERKRERSSGRDGRRGLPVRGPGPGRFFCPWTKVPLLQARGARGEIPHRTAKRARGRLFSRPGSPPLPNLSNRKKSLGVKRSAPKTWAVRWAKASLRKRVARRSAGQTAAGNNAQRSRPACTRTRIGPHRRPKRNG